MSAAQYLADIREEALMHAKSTYRSFLEPKFVDLAWLNFKLGAPQHDMLTQNDRSGWYAEAIKLFAKTHIHNAWLSEYNKFRKKTGNGDADQGQNEQNVLMNLRGFISSCAEAQSFEELQEAYADAQVLKQILLGLTVPNSRLHQLLQDSVPPSLMEHTTYFTNNASAKKLIEELENKLTSDHAAVLQTLKAIKASVGL